MPGWARPGDIWFDHAAAAGAVEAVAALRLELTTSWAAEASAAAEALAGWDGMAAQAFVTSLAARRNASGFADQDLARLQTAMELAVDDAIVAQRRIDALQAEWDAERITEGRAREEATEAAAVEESVTVTPDAAAGSPFAARVR